MRLAKSLGMYGRGDWEELYLRQVVSLLCWYYVLLVYRVVPLVQITAL